MAGIVIWIDTEHAKFFKIDKDKIERKEFKLHGMRHSNSHTDKHHNEQEEHFYHEVAAACTGAEELLIFGPGMGKDHFKNHLEKHHRNNLFRVLVGVETLDRITDNQILEAARKFFKKYNTFHANI